ncbi:MAG: M20/M25/M40 family metallo-hydrolase [Nitrospiraceae bacterium]
MPQDERHKLQAHLQALIGDRHPTSAPAKLRETEIYLADRFRRLGLNVASHSFKALGSTYRNVIGASPTSRSSSRSGKRSNPPLIIAAHYDTIPKSPGADDNASGLAVMLEAARKLVKVPLNGEVRFIAFCLEEHNLLGSLAYAAHLKETRQALMGAIVLECVGFTSSQDGSQQKPPGVPIAVPTTGDFLAVVGNTASSTLAAGFEAAAKKHVPELKTVPLVVPGNGEQLPDTRRSDHAAFWHYGYPAIMLTDTANFRNPNYHRPTDTIDTLDFMFMVRIAKALTAAVIKFADHSQP